MREDPRHRPNNLFFLAVWSTVILVGMDFMVNLLLTNERGRMIYSDMIAPVFGFLACAALFMAARRSATHSKRLALAWGMIGLSVLCFVLGDISWGILELGLEEPPFPSIADVFYLAYYPLWLFGAFLLPHKPATSGEKFNILLDTGIVMSAAILGFWNFLMGPIISSNAGYPFVEQFILLAYPVGDLVLLWSLLRIIYNRSDQQDEISAFLLAGSLTVTIFFDGVYTYQSLMGTYVSGGFIDISWRASLLMAGLAGVSQITTLQPSNLTGKFPRSLEFLSSWKEITPYLPYVWLVAAYILLVEGELTSLPMSFLSLSLSVAGIICLVLLRQIITLTENKKLNDQLQRTMNKLQTQATELEWANKELQNEIAERKEVEKKLTYDSLHDAMTGLSNRVLFVDRLGQAIEYCKRRIEYTFAVLFVDVDQFKVINDSLGHLMGDQLLIAVGRRMKECLRSSDTIARFGGDEFAILLEITGEKNSAILVAEKIQEILKLPFKLDGNELYISASIGVVTNVAEYEHPEDVLRDADIAMYQAKASGKACLTIFDVQMRSQAFSRLEMEQEIRTALENREFQLYYQPIISLKSDRVIGVEALIRWRHPKRGLLLPGEFLPVAEESGLILPIGEWVLHEACAQLKRWQNIYPRLQDICINVNISNRQFSQPNFVEEVIRAIRVNGLKAESLRLEITENVLISNYGAANQIFTKLRDQGIHLQIDDFGSGYSALGYLQHFPISTIKIDKSFIDNMGKGQKGIALIRAIVSMTRELGMETIAEGIETSEQLDELKSLLCDFGQGFLLSRPLDKEAAEKILTGQQATDDSS